jgi:hypothetical protein
LLFDDEFEDEFDDEFDEELLLELELELLLEFELLFELELLLEFELLFELEFELLFELLPERDPSSSRSPLRWWRKRNSVSPAPSSLPKRFWKNRPTGSPARCPSSACAASAVDDITVANMMCLMDFIRVSPVSTGAARTRGAMVRHVSLSVVVIHAHASGAVVDAPTPRSWIGHHALTINCGGWV